MVNDAQPLMPPYQAGTPEDHRVPLQTAPHIGDRLDAAGVSWVWYAQGWADGLAGHPSPLFAYHHQAFNYFANVGADPVAKARHLKDEDHLPGGAPPRHAAASLLGEADRRLQPAPRPGHGHGRRTSG